MGNGSADGGAADSTHDRSGGVIAAAAGIGKGDTSRRKRADRQNRDRRKKFHRKIQFYGIRGQSVG
jgi:hypothetical protein